MRPGHGPEIKPPAAATMAAACIILAIVPVIVSGCSSSKSVPRYRTDPAEESTPPPTETPPEALPSPGSVFEYRVSNENCDCRDYRTGDPDHAVRYTFSAEYSMQSGFLTSIEVEIENATTDTLFLDPGSAMVSSRNIEYQYNGKFIPLPDIVIPPGDTDLLRLDGKEVTGTPSWTRIAGEQLTLTLKGMRLGLRTLKKQVVYFVPENPLLRELD